MVVGGAAPGVAMPTLHPVEVVIGGVALLPMFAGLHPTLVGLYQVNAVVPDVPAGEAVPIQLRISGVTSTDQATIAVSQAVAAQKLAFHKSSNKNSTPPKENPAIQAKLTPRQEFVRIGLGSVEPDEHAGIVDLTELFVGLASANGIALFARSAAHSWSLSLLARASRSDSAMRTGLEVNSMPIR
jgi:hypothetical protein